MRVLRIIVLVTAMLVLTTQAVRHVYVRFIEPRTSVLDAYEQTETQKAIQTAASLDELLGRYDLAHQRTDELDKLRKGLEDGKTRDEIYVIREKFNEEHKEDYERESDLKRAVGDWEAKSKEILELRVFWAFGLALFLVGAFLQTKQLGWLGMSLILSGIVEMVWWTSPSFRFAGSPLEFDRMLLNKLLFTLFTIAILITWRAIVRNDEET